MGCDIHIALEKKVGDKWVMVNRVEGTPGTRRNYDRFARLAGVRSGGVHAGPIGDVRGLPEDISESAKLFVGDWEGDGHSHSWMTLAEALPIFIATDHRNWEHGEPKPATEVDFQMDTNEYFGYWPHNGGGTIENYRIVFFFDN